MINISLLCPARGRPTMLAQSIDTLLKHASDPAAFEVLVFIDEDDPERDNYTLSVQGEIVIGPRVGYPRLYEVIGKVLVPRAKGTWLMLWNDDAMMMTPGWDVIISESPAGVLCPDSPQGAHTTGINTFPIVPRTWVDLVRWARNGANDTWWQEIGKMMGKHINIPVMIDHTPTDSRTQGYDPGTFFTLQNYALMGFQAGRLHQRFFA